MNAGHGNRVAVSRALQAVGHECQYVSSPKDLKVSTGNIIIPGVSSFDSAASLLRRLKLFDALIDQISVQLRPVLGICVGMQLLLSNSEEGEETGFGFVKGRLEKFTSEPEKPITIPHMGWNSVEFSPGSKLKPTVNNPEFYFLHSYRLLHNNQAYASGLTIHGQEFISVIESENIFGVQFHPEKSHRAGLELLDKFARVN